MERSPVRNLMPDFDFTIEPDTPEEQAPPTIRYRRKARLMQRRAYDSEQGRRVIVEFRKFAGAY